MDKNQTKEAVKIVKKFCSIVKVQFPDLKADLVGSYARGEALRSTSDIDIILFQMNLKT